MFKTKNDIPEATRVKVVELLNARLADCIDLQTQIKQAHWNVKGPNFIALHELFDKINEEVEDYVDDIAERAAQLGGVAEGAGRSGGWPSFGAPDRNLYLVRRKQGGPAMSSEQGQADVGAPDSVEVTLLVNGSPRSLRLEPRVMLLDALREYAGLTGTKKG